MTSLPARSMLYTSAMRLKPKGRIAEASSLTKERPMKLTHLLASAALLAGIATATPSLAIDTSVAAQAKHFAECLGWMLSDPAKHAQYCSPGHDVFVHATTSYGKLPIHCDEDKVTADAGL